MKIMEKRMYVWLGIFLCVSLPALVFSRDGIVLSGQPGPHNNQKHFLENGLDRCQRLKKKVVAGEKVVWYVFNSGNEKRGGYNDSLLKVYTDSAKAEAIEVVIIKNNRDIASDMNRRSIGDTLQKVRYFYYFGHSTLGHLEMGYVNGFFINKLFSKSLRIHLLEPLAFCSSSVINVVGGCRTALPTKMGGKSVAEKLAPLAGDKVVASNVRVFYPGGPVSDKTLVRKNNGNVIELKGLNSGK
jgi:hypothetical protein